MNDYFSALCEVANMGVMENLHWTALDEYYIIFSKSYTQKFEVERKMRPPQHQLLPIGTCTSISKPVILLCFFLYCMYHAMPPMRRTTAAPPTAPPAAAPATL